MQILRVTAGVARVVLVGSLVLVGGGAGGAAQGISAEPDPSQLEILQGTAVRLDGTAAPDGPRPEGYRWEIVQGVGGVLYNGDRPEAIFQAPAIDAELEVFVVRLTVDYPEGLEASSTVHIRVHREMAVAVPEAEEDSIEDIMTDYYRRERELREDRKQREDRSQPVIVQQSVSYGFGVPGFGWGGGWPVTIPVHAPILVPPPGAHWGVDDGRWDGSVILPTSSWPDP